MSQPRSPCWKIDHRYEAEGVARFIAESAIAGWYYRVLAPGHIGVGDPFEHVERVPNAVTLRQFWAIAGNPHATADDLRSIAQSPALAASWRQKLMQRIAHVTARA